MICKPNNDEAITMTLNEIKIAICNILAIEKATITNIKANVDNEKLTLIEQCELKNKALFEYILQVINNDTVVNSSSSSSSELTQQKDDLLTQQNNAMSALMFGGSSYIDKPAKRQNDDYETKRHDTTFKTVAKQDKWESRKTLTEIYLDQNIEVTINGHSSIDDREDVDHFVNTMIESKKIVLTDDNVIVSLNVSTDPVLNHAKSLNKDVKNCTTPIQPLVVVSNKVVKQYSKPILETFGLADLLDYQQAIRKISVTTSNGKVHRYLRDKVHTGDRKKGKSNKTDITHYTSLDKQSATVKDGNVLYHFIWQQGKVYCKKEYPNGYSSTVKVAFSYVDKKQSVKWISDANTDYKLFYAAKQSIRRKTEVSKDQNSWKNTYISDIPNIIVKGNKWGSLSLYKVTATDVIPIGHQVLSREPERLSFMLLDERLEVNEKGLRKFLSECGKKHLHKFLSDLKKQYTTFVSNREKELYYRWSNKDVRNTRNLVRKLVNQVSEKYDDNTVTAIASCTVDYYRKLNNASGVKSILINLRNQDPDKFKSRILEITGYTI